MARYCIAYDSMEQFLQIKGKESLSDMVSDWKYIPRILSKSRFNPTSFAGLFSAAVRVATLSLAEKSLMNEVGFNQTPVIQRADSTIHWITQYVLVELTS